MYGIKCKSTMCGIIFYIIQDTRERCLMAFNEFIKYIEDKPNEWDKYCYTDNIYCSEDNGTFKTEKSNDRYILTTDKEQITFELIKEFTERF